jgi:competence protein ComEC
LPCGLFPRGLAWLLRLPCVLPRLASPAWYQQFDVGQGSAARIESTSGALQLDTGPGFDPWRSSYVQQVRPRLQASGALPANGLALSHGDQDHAGGLSAAIADLEGAPLLSSVPKLQQATTNQAPCQAGLKLLGGQVLHPPRYFPYLRNQSSCVWRFDLVAHFAQGRTHFSVLNPGDIDSLIEARLVREQSERLPSTVLVAPHHGSASASSERFLDQVAPSIVLISAAANSRFGHPHANVLARYCTRNVAVFNTGWDGALRLELRGEELWLDAERILEPRWYRRPPSHRCG